MALSYKDVAEILRIIDASACEEVVLEVEGLRLVVRKGAGGASPVQPASRPVEVRPAAPAQAATPSPLPAREPEPAAGLAVRAPMIGTFYRRPSPKDPPFVEAGQRVAKGDPLCLLEVMKLYTTITAPAAGVVVEITAEDGTLVEYDQVLVVIGPE